jgi:hypothetical protein
MGGESKGKEPQKAQAYIPHKIHKRKASIPQRKLPRKGSEKHKKGKPGRTQTSLEEPRRIIYIS